MQTKTLIVAAIKSGTVIDHIEKGQAVKIINLLQLYSSDQTVSLGMNFKSTSKGFKEIIKIEGIRLQEVELDKIAIFSPDATINVIENYEVIEKFSMKLPKLIKNLAACPNNKCISNHEPMESCFQVIQYGKNVQLSCYYCRNNFNNI